MKFLRKKESAAAVGLALMVGLLILWRLSSVLSRPAPVGEDIRQVELDDIYLPDTDLEVDFSQVLLSRHNETRQLIVSTQTATVTTKLTDRLIRQLDFDFLKKTQNVSYTGTGYFVVDLDRLTADDIICDRDGKTVTILIPHPHLESIDIRPEDIVIEDVQEGLLAWGDIKMTVADYNEIAGNLRLRLEETFDTVANGQTADRLALAMVQEVYEPVVHAIDRRYDVRVEWK